MPATSEPPTSVAKIRKYRRTRRPRRPAPEAAEGTTLCASAMLQTSRCRWPSPDCSDHVSAYAATRYVQGVGCGTADHPLEIIVGGIHQLEILGYETAPKDPIDVQGCVFSALVLRDAVAAK